MKFLLKIIIGVLVGVFLFGGSVFAVTSNYQEIQDKIDTYSEKASGTDNGDAKAIYLNEITKLSNKAKSLKDNNGNIRSTKEEADASNADIKEEKTMLAEIKKEEEIKRIQKKEKEGKIPLTDEEKKTLNSAGLRSECRNQNGLSTSILYDKNKQHPFCFSIQGDSASCVSGECADGKGTTLRVYDKGVADKKGLDLIQYFLSTILGFTLKFGAMLAVLAIILGGIQVSMSMENESGSVGKEKIIGGIAALLVLFFAGVILNFINPNYYVW